MDVSFKIGIWKKDIINVLSDTQRQSNKYALLWLLLRPPMSALNFYFYFYFLSITYMIRTFLQVLFEVFQMGPCRFLVCQIVGLLGLTLS